MHLGFFIHYSLDASLLLLSDPSHLVVKLVDNSSIGLPHGFLETGRGLDNEKLLLGSINALGSSLFSQQCSISGIALHRYQFLLVPQVCKALYAVHLPDESAIILFTVSWMQLLL